MIYDVSHRTTISYAAPVRLARFNLRLKPASWPGQTLLSHALSVQPAPSAIQHDHGPWLVNRSRFTLREPITELVIDSRFSVDVAEPGLLRHSIPAPTVREVGHAARNRQDMSASGPASYLYGAGLVQHSPAIAGWAAPHLDGQRSVMDAGAALMAAIHAEFRYDSSATRTNTPPDDVFATRRGVCQDFSRIMIIGARAHGIPAAYVSGYLRTLPPPGQERLVGADAMHAWVNLWCGDQLGWIGFDPTNNIFAESSHIFAAMGRDYTDVAPIDGIFIGGSGQDMDVAVDVLPREGTG